MALLASGVAVVQLVPEFAFPVARHLLGLLLAALSALLAVTAVREWQRVQTAMRRAEDLPPSRVPLVLGATLALMALFVLVLLLLSFGRS